MPFEAKEFINLVFQANCIEDFIHGKSNKISLKKIFSYFVGNLNFSNLGFLQVGRIGMDYHMISGAYYDCCIPSFATPTFRYFPIDDNTAKLLIDIPKMCKVYNLEYYHSHYDNIGHWVVYPNLVEFVKKMLSDPRFSNQKNGFMLNLNKDYVDENIAIYFDNNFSRFVLSQIIDLMESTDVKTAFQKFILNDYSLCHYEPQIMRAYDDLPLLLNSTENVKFGFILENRDNYCYGNGNGGYVRY